MSKTMPWIRLYVEVLDDLKIARLPDHLGWLWCRLLLVTERCEGKLPPAGDIAFILRCDEATITANLEALVVTGLLDRNRNGDLVPHNWEGRQFRSDRDPTAASRKQAERARKKGHAPVTPAVTTNVTDLVTRDITDQSHHGHAPGHTPQTTDSDSEADSERAVSPAIEAPPVPSVETQNRGEDCAAEAGAAVDPQRKRPKRLSADWTPSERNIADARKGPKGLGGLSPEDIEVETQAFKDWWAQAPNGVKLDWDATWRTWVKRAVEDRIKRAPRPAAGQVVAFKPKAAPRIMDIPAASPEEWSRRLKGWRRSREWVPVLWGPNPEERGCAAPRKLFADAGVTPLPIMVDMGNGPQPFDTSPALSTATAPDLLDAEFSQGATP